MSWHYLRELEGEFLEDICSGGELLQPLKSKITHAEFYCNGNLMDSYLDSLFGTTLEPLMVSLGQEKSMSSQVDFPVRTFQPPERVMDLMESEAECGKKWHGWLAKYDPATSLWKTPQCSLLGEELESLETLPKWGMTVNGLLWEQPTLERRIKGTEFGLWRTPDTGAGGTSGLLKEGKTHRDNGQPIQIRLVDQVNNPHLWPTPCSTDYKGSGKTGQLRDRLDYAVERGATKSKIYGEQQITGQLNPPFPEWLMGWPQGWTDLKPLVMDKSPCVPLPHGES